MKKRFYLVGVTMLLSLPFLFAGCSLGGNKVFQYLKTERNFVGNPSYNGGKYTVSFTVNEDLSYSLSVSDEYNSVLKDYSVEGTQMEYLGQVSDTRQSTWLGVTTHTTRYMHVVKLPEATVEYYDNTLAFYLLAESDSKRGDITIMKLKTAFATYGKDDIGNFEISVSGGYALKKA